MADDRVFFVQLPHPKDEPLPGRFVAAPATRSARHRDVAAGGLIMPWNTEPKHCRKFLISSGRYVADDDESVSEAELVFWGEWEPPSEIVTTWPADGHLPRALHRPYWFRPRAGTARQNTDPWVFGDHMIYSNCKQPSTPSLQGLRRGSVVFFGSTFNRREFWVDAVFVVASSEYGGIRRTLRDSTSTRRSWSAQPDLSRPVTWRARPAPAWFCTAAPLSITG